MGKITMVLPFVETSSLVEWTRGVYREEADVEIVGIAEGVDPTMNFSDIELNIPGIVRRVVAAQEQGAAAAVIGCFGDPGLLAARELCSIPVVGAGESTLALAATLGDRVVIFEPGNEFVYATERMVRAYEMTHKVTEVLAVDIPMDACAAIDAGSMENAEGQIKKTVEEMGRMIRDTGAHVAVLGCIGLAGFHRALVRWLEAENLPCPLIEPGVTVLRYTKTLLGLGLNQSRVMNLN